MKQKTPLRRVNHEWIARLYREGRTQPEIATILNINNSTVSRSLRRSEVPTRQGGRVPKPLDDAEILERYYRLEGYSNIARDMGVPTERIKQILLSHGVKLRRVGWPPTRERPKQDHVGYETEFDRMKPLVYQRSGGVCEAKWPGTCRGFGTHVHHRKLRSQGGTNDLWNLLHVCLPCHMKIHGNVAQARAFGFLVRRTADPFTVPVSEVRKIF